jgi:hypothetical protein
MEVSGQLHASVALLPGETSPDTHRVGNWVGPQSRSGLYGEEKNHLSITGIEPRLLGHPARSLVAIPTEKFRLPIHDILTHKISYSQILSFLVIAIKPKAEYIVTCTPRSRRCLVACKP